MRSAGLSSSVALLVTTAVFVFATVSQVAVVGALSCINENGANTDWFVVLKAPTISGQSDGTEYAYADSSSSGSSFNLVTSRSMTSSSSAIGATLNGLYSKGKSSPSSTGWAMYNDEKPDGSVYSTGGHTKGVIGFDATTKLGFWLIHSTPRFPAPVSQGPYSWPSDENIYAQSYLCITFTFDQLDQAGIQLSYNQAHIYDSNMPTSLMNALPNLAKAIQGYQVKTADSSTKQMTSNGGHRFVSFAKTVQWDQDLYNTLVEPYIQDSMWIETWMRPYQASCCKPSCKYDSVNVATLQLGNIQYSETNDHSKWAIAQTTGNNWLCIGDINRNTSQWKRGGGTMCFENATIANMFFKAILTVDSCSKAE